MLPVGDIACRKACFLPLPARGSVPFRPRSDPNSPVASPGREIVRGSGGWRLVFPPTVDRITDQPGADKDHTGTDHQVEDAPDGGARE